MSSFTAILDAQADGTLHLPLPSDWLKYRARVSAQLELIKLKNLQASESY
jgi:hypothetical protein